MLTYVNPPKKVSVDIFVIPILNGFIQFESVIQAHIEQDIAANIFFSLNDTQ